MQKSLVVSLFCFLLSLGLAFLYWILRAGFSDNSLFVVLKVVGVSAFILLSPETLPTLQNRFSDSINRVFFNKSIIAVYLIVLIAGLGYVTFLPVDLSIILAILGYVLLAKALYNLLRRVKLVDSLIIVSIGVFLSMWVAGVTWLWYLKPYILENWAYGTDKVDTLFHVALSQMIKTYGIPSTGLDGLPPMTYHWGSHWLFAQFSKFLHLPVLVVYQLCYPVIFAPLLFKTFLSFVLDVKDAYKPEIPREKLNFVFWVIFLTVFIGFFKSYFRGNEWAQYTSGGTGSTIFIFISESYCLSIMLLMAILSLLVNFWKYRIHLSQGQQSLFLFLLLPLLLMILGIIKISTLFVLCGLIGFLFIRLSLYTQRLYLASIVVIGIAALAIFTVGFERKEDHGEFEWFYFYENWNISIPQFVFLFFLWSYIFIIVFILKEKLYTIPLKKLISSKKLLPVESVLCICVVGFLPSMLLKIQNFDALYFLEIQVWVSAALVLVYIPFYAPASSSLKNLVLRSLAMAPLIYFMVINTKSYFGNIYVESIKHHKFVLDATGNTTDGLRIRDMVKSTSNLTKDDYEKSKVLSFFFKLRELDKLPTKEKAKSLVYVDFRDLITRSNYKWSLGCHNIALTVPSISGMAMVDGFDVTYYELCGGCCEQIEFVYGYYPKWKTRTQISTPPTVQYLKERVRKMGFETLVYFNPDTETFEIIKV